MELHVKKKFFDAIANGQKIYEGRLAKDKYKNLEIGEKIFFKTDDTDEFIEKQISSLHIFSSFDLAGKVLGIKNILPGIPDGTTISNIYYEFYPPEEEKIHNVIMIGFS